MMELELWSKDAQYVVEMCLLLEDRLRMLMFDCCFDDG